MKYLPSRRPALVLLAALFALVPLLETPARGQEPAKSAIVLAIENARPSVVAIRMPKANGKKDTVGTGVIIHAEGIVVTNRHVVGSSKAVYVRLHDGKEYVAQVVQADPNADLALLRIQGNGTKFQAMPLEPMDHLWVGEEVIAIGHPYGYTFTVSRGIVSALGREITMPTGEVLSGLIQTDASINPGNSGGPLLNSQGQIIGINVALREGAQGIAFAINIESVRSFVGKHLGWQYVSQKSAPAPVVNTFAEVKQSVAPDVKAVSKPGPASKAGGQVKDLPKSKLAKAEDPALAAAPVAHEETRPEEKGQKKETQTTSPTPAAPISSTQTTPPAATPSGFDSVAQTADFSVKPLLVALLGLLIVVISQQYFLMRRLAARPA